MKTDFRKAYDGGNVAVLSKKMMGNTIFIIEYPFVLFKMCNFAPHKLIARSPMHFFEMNRKGMGRKVHQIKFKNYIFFL